HPDLGGELTQDDVASVVIFEGTGDSQADADRVAKLILAHRAHGIDEAKFVEDHGTPTDTFKKAYARFNDIANTAFNWLETTGVIEREQKTVIVAASARDAAQDLVDAYGARPLLKHADDVERFQRSYGLPPGKQKDTRNLAAAPAITRREFVQ